MKKLFTVCILFSFSLFCKAQTFSWSGNESILDFQSDTISIIVSGVPAVIDTNYGIAHICMNITHSYESDLLIKLVSPNGFTVTLIDNIGGSGNDFLGTCVGMDGTAFTNAQPPYSGIFFPVGDVSSFNNGQNPNGTWLLIVTDIASPDTGTIYNASIEFTNNPPRLIVGSGSGAPVGTYVCASCVCPGGAAACDLLPDMTASAHEININHREEPGFLYISNATPNIGFGPLDIYGIDSCFCGTTRVPCNTICPNGEELQHVVKQRIFQKEAGKDTLSFYDRVASKMTFHRTHGHLHVDNWANYSLRTATANPDARTWPIVANGTKQSFCLINLGTCAGKPGECVDNNGNTILTVPNNNVGWHTGCGKNQGIYPGNYDVYSVNLNDPIPLQNVCNGNYYIVSITDPDNDFVESDENNNWVAVPITLTQQSIAPIITASGSTTICEGGQITLTSSTENNYLWSTGETTQSIVVSTAGPYTVSTTCGAYTATSLPTSINVIPPGSIATVSIAISNGSNPTCPAVALSFTATAVYGGNNASYQWKVNGINVGNNNPVFTTSGLTNGQVVSCVMTSSISCLSATQVNSNDISMQINPPVDPTVIIAQTGGNNPLCPGDEATFTATISDGNNPDFQWSINGVNVGLNSQTFSSNNISNGQIFQCSINATATCPTIKTLGTSTVLNGTRVDSGVAYPTYYGNARQQYLIRASELNSLGLSRGFINSLGFNVAGTTGDPVILNGYTIKIAQTNANVMTTSFLNPSLTTVFGPVNYKPTLNSVNTHLFSSPFYWDGISNLVVDICFSNQVIGNLAYQTYQTTTPFISNTYYRADGTGGAGACTKLTGNMASVRPNMIFTHSAVKTVSSNIITMAVNASNVYTFNGMGNWNIASNWVNNLIPPSVLPACSQIFINPPTDEECILNINQTIAAGAKITVMTNKKFRVPGNLIIQE